jgi:hypothetical protein
VGVVVLLDRNSLDGLVVAGIARALRRSILLLVHTDSKAPNMIDATVVPWHDDNIDKVIGSELPKFGRAIHGASNGEGKSPSVRNNGNGHSARSKGARPERKAATKRRITMANGRAQTRT